MRSNARLQEWVKDMEISNWRDPMVDALSLAGKRTTGWVVAGEDVGFQKVCIYAVMDKRDLGTP